MIHVIRILFVLSLLIAGATCLIAQSTATVTRPQFLDQVNGITADDAVRMAIANNDQINALRKEAEASERLVAQAGQRARMSVEASGQQRTFGSAHRYTIQGTMPLELGGRRRTRVLTAQREAEVKLLAVAQAENALAARVRMKFGETLALAYKHELVEDFLRSLSESFRLIQARVVEGKTAPLEENMLLVELNRVRAKREVAESNVLISLLELRTLIGLDPAESLTLRGDFDQSPSTFDSASVLTARALDSRPDLLVLKAMEDLADAEIEMAASNGKLDAMATLGYQRLKMTETVQFNYVVFGIRFLLPYKNRSRDAIEAAVISKEAMEKRRAFGELVVRQDVAKALVRYDSAFRSMSITRAGVVGQAEQNLDVVRQMYELGSNSLLEYLAEQRRVIELRESLIDSELETYLAKVEIYRATNAPELVTR
ncbi:MAG: TolC family protein [Acidobacteriota bacterium]|nr:TolC family protein [Acidobacteriota bacterium]MDH3527971.1 TolC family protein [Acidobacteriota bacterium]